MAIFDDEDTVTMVEEVLKDAKVPMWPIAISKKIEEIFGVKVHYTAVGRTKSKHIKKELTWHPKMYYKE